MLKQFLLFSFLMVAVCQVFAASDYPKNYKKICKIGQTCSVSSSTKIAFGAKGKFVYKVLKGSFRCDVSTFGKDPISSKKNKRCSIPKSGSGGSSKEKSDSKNDISKDSINEDDSSKDDSGKDDSSKDEKSKDEKSSKDNEDSGSSSDEMCGSGNGAKVCLRTKGTGDGVELKWSVSGKIKQADVYRDTDTNRNGRKALKKDVSGNKYMDKKASEDKTYYYWIKFKAGSKSYNAGPIKGELGSGGSSDDDSSSKAEDKEEKKEKTDKKDKKEKKDNSSKGSSGACKAGATITGKTVDCGGKTIGLSCKGDSEKQPPVLTLKNATVKNVTISKSGGSDGIHCTGNCTIQNAVWEDICEDAATLKKGTDGKTMTIIGGSAYNAKGGYGGKPDKVFQHNSKNSTTVVKGGFTLTGEHGKLWRSCGNCTGNGGPRKIKIDGVKINAKIGSIVGVNGNFGDKATIRNLKIKNYKSGSPKVCVEYKGVQKGKGESKKIGEKWNTSACDVSKSDVKAL